MHEETQSQRACDTDSHQGEGVDAYLTLSPHIPPPLASASHHPPSVLENTETPNPSLWKADVYHYNAFVVDTSKLRPIFPAFLHLSFFSSCLTFLSKSNSTGVLPGLSFPKYLQALSSNVQSALSPGLHRGLLHTHTHTLQSWLPSHLQKVLSYNVWSKMTLICPR